jgi:hypothetical protein
MATLDMHLSDSPSIKGREDRYTVVRVRTDAILKSWRSSLFSFEWLNPDGSIRSLDELPMHERDKRVKIEQKLAGGEVLDRPVLGIGIMDNVEIGAGRDIFLTLAAKGFKDIDVHIPASNAKDFKQFLSA